MKIILSILGRHMSAEKKEWKIYAAFLLGMAMCLFPVASNYIAFSRAVGYEIHFLEPYIVAMSTSYQFVAIFLGLFLLLADAPFLSERTAYELLRVGKRRWLTERVIYVNVMCGIYFTVMLITCALIALMKGNVRFDNQWSASMRMLAERQPSFAISEFRLYFPYPQLLRQLTPCGAAMCSLILSWMYGSVLSMVALFFNAICRRRMGIVVSLGIHIAGYVINANGPMYFPQQCSPLSCAVLAYYFDETYGLDALVTIVAFCGIWYALWHCVRRYSDYMEIR